MLKKVENVCYWQVLRMMDEDRNLVSVANTEDNWRETAVCINWGSTETDKWYIKMWNWKEKIEVAKTITEALEILYWIDAERSQYSTDHRSDLFEKLKNQDD